MAGQRPVSTYRIQFTADFGFQNASRLIGYLKSLGVGALYASPVWEARRGSPHGYDVTDPSKIRAALGGEAAFRELAAGLKAASLGLLLDIVPNHMAASTQSPWWNDVLEHGPYSEYARYYDIDWQAPPGGRLVLPVLGEPRQDALERGLIRLAFDRRGLGFHYYDNRFPLEPGSYATALAGVLRGAEARRLGTESAALPGWREGATDAAGGERRAKAADLKARWCRLLGESQIEQIDIEVPRLAALLALQPYELAFWSEGLARLNYRRFFDISDLAGLRVDETEVFDAVHRLPLALVGEGLASGLRVDHIDGLRDPGAYVQRLSASLRAAAADRPYLVIEKILELDEELPDAWQVDGTTGYEFLNALNGVFVDVEGLRALQQAFRTLNREPRTFHEIAFEKKRIVLRELFGPELDSLSARLIGLIGEAADGVPIRPEDAVQALLLVTAAMPVYRTYMGKGGVSASDRAHVETAVELAARAHDAPGRRVLDLLRDLILEPRPPGDVEDQRAEFVYRWQQLTGPATAKGVEDAALYSYVPLVSLNEVGGDPTGDHTSVGFFHGHNRRRATAFTGTLNATSTHDTKRSEDVRARLNVLSERATEWLARLERWRAINASVRRDVGGSIAPPPTDELLIYQTLAGMWPLENRAIAGVEQRAAAFMIKACREAKERSSWLSPHADYEEALTAFVHEILNGATSGEFAASFLPFQDSIALAGACNSLSQVLLKVASPGVPDFYQGSEGWDFSLTDPDNRRPVDFDRLERRLAEMSSAGADRSSLIPDLLQNWRDGRIKTFVTWQSLAARAADIEVFERGDYLPLEAEGPHAQSLCAFARRSQGRWVIAVAPRLTTRLPSTPGWPLGEKAWADTKLALPLGSPVWWRDIFTGTAIHVDQTRPSIRVAEILAKFPVVLLNGSEGGQP